MKVKGQKWAPAPGIIFILTFIFTCGTDTGWPGGGGSRRVDTQIRSSLRGRSRAARAAGPVATGVSSRTADARSRAPARRRERRAESSVSFAFPRGLRGSAGETREPLNGGSLRVLPPRRRSRILVQQVHRALRTRDRASVCCAPGLREGRPGDPVLDKPDSVDHSSFHLIGMKWVP